MTIELKKEDRNEAIGSLQRYFRTELDGELGNLAADALLRFFEQEIGPLIYNAAILDAQERLQARVAELDIDCHEAPFAYWKKQERRR